MTNVNNKQTLRVYIDTFIDTAISPLPRNTAQTLGKVVQIIYTD